MRYGEWREFESGWSAPVDIRAAREAAEALTKAHFGAEDHGVKISTPMQLDDSDILLYRALDELEELRKMAVPVKPQMSRSFKNFLRHFRPRRVRLGTATPVLYH